MKTLIALVAVAALLSVGSVSAASAPTPALQSADDGDQRIVCIGLGQVVCTVYYAVCRPHNVCIIR